MAYCPECGTETNASDKYCIECGTDLDRTRGGESVVDSDDDGSRKKSTKDDTAGTSRSSSNPEAYRETIDSDPDTTSKRWIDEYEIAVWIGSVIFALLTFPIGLAIPAYFFVKASKDTPVDQSPLEVWTVILWGIFGIVAVEAGGRKGAKALWGILGGVIALAILLIIIAAI